jgi:hypothetical protein
MGQLEYVVRPCERAVRPYHRTVHFRRAILLFALVLGLTALAAAVSPTQQKDQPAAVPAPAGTTASIAPRQVIFEAHDSGVPQVRRAHTGQHVMITVASSQGGLVRIPLLGRTASVSTSAPARFDVLLPSNAARYDVLLELSGGPSEPRRVGTLITRP